jgi:hypothetical protein
MSAIAAEGRAEICSIYRLVTQTRATNDIEVDSLVGDVELTLSRAHGIACMPAL